MNIILLILFGLCAVDLKIAKEGEFFDDFLSYKKTEALKGIFVILVFIRHYLQYVKLDSPMDSFAVWLDGNMSQLLVTLFIFFSGFGIMEGIKRKSSGYVRTFPVKAIRLLIHFDIAVCLYLILGIALKSTFSLKQILLSLVCWDSLGNSNWYIFSILMVYVISFIAFIWVKDHYYLGAVVLTLLCVGYIIVLGKYKDNYWFNTIMCYPLGIWYSLLQDKIRKISMKNDIMYFGILALLLTAYTFLMNKRQNIVIYCVWAALFTLIVLHLTMKLQLDNAFLQFLGAHVFSLYILQRLPMLLFVKKANIGAHSWAFFVISFIVTICLALIYDKLMKYCDAILDRVIFKRG